MQEEMIKKAQRVAEIAKLEASVVADIIDKLLMCGEDPGIAKLKALARKFAKQSNDYAVRATNSTSIYEVYVNQYNAVKYARKVTEILECVYAIQKPRAA